MNPATEFTEAQADFLTRFLASPERPPRTFTYPEVAGFLFAMACVPEPIPPSEWIPLMFDDAEPNYADLAEAEACMGALLALYNRIVEEVNAQRPTLPPRCEPLDDPMANFGTGAPLGLWCAGFGAGHDWLEEAWPENLPQEADEMLGFTLVTLTFFESQELAQSYADATGGDAPPLEEWASDMVRMFPGAMRAYVELAAAVFGREQQRLM